MAAQQRPLKRIAIRESSLFAGCLLAGMLLLPIGVFTVGKAVFGAYGGDGYMDFFTRLTMKVFAFDGDAWFLILSPYLALQTLRLTLLGWRKAANSQGALQ